MENNNNLKQITKIALFNVSDFMQVLDASSNFQSPFSSMFPYSC